MENASTGQTRVPLSRALEQDHREIDEVIKRCADGSALDADERGALKRAVDELRRHIYAEEELLFPPLRLAGMTGPILVMLREHGQMWPLLDTLDHGLAEGVDSDLLRAACHQLFVLLQHHNPKEEQIIYPELDRAVGPTVSVDVQEFFDAGQVPAGWICHFLRAGTGRLAHPG
ncbi:MAG TPA: hemerythrin domain-containing protein [Nocardioidaceae bacterium]|nr:hemerythrin domain-containing protein [Nocardioidaceae bacterium]